MPQVTRLEVVAAARRIYADAPAGTRMMQSLRPYICPFEKLLGHVPSGASVLDVGCGAGLLLGLIAHFDPNASGLGFDTSAGGIAVAQAIARRPEFSGRLRFELWSATAEWPSGSYDVVSMIDVLHHVPPLQHPAVIEKAMSRVRPGGLLLYKDMAPLPAWQSGWNRLHDLILARQWIHYRAIADVEAWVAGAGAATVAQRRIDIGPYGHELLVSRARENA